MSSLVKIGIPEGQAAGVRFARRAKQILDERDVQYARADANCRHKLKMLIEESEQPWREEPERASTPDTPEQPVAASA